MYKAGDYLAPQLMGNYDGRTIGTSNLAVQNIFSAPSPSIICNIKQPSTATGQNPALFFDIKQSEGIKIACKLVSEKYDKDLSRVYKF